MEKRTKEEQEAIKKANPSLCYSCVNARRISEKQEGLGYVGCVAPFKHYDYFPSANGHIIAFDKLETTVDVHARPFATASNSSYGRMLAVSEVSRCPFVKDIITLAEQEANKKKANDYDDFLL